MPVTAHPTASHTLALLGVLSALSWGLALTYFATGHGNLDATGHALGRDFVNLWTAGHLVADGRVAAIFDPAQFGAVQRALLSPNFPLHFWSYPPTFLFAAAPFGKVSYLPGFILWSLAGFVALAAAARTFFPRWGQAAWLLTSPAVAVNLVLGQNGAFTAALIMSGCILMARRPAASGALFGVLTFKPHLGLLAPIAMLAQRRWTTVLIAGLVTLALAGLSVVAFGIDAWRAFVQKALPMQAAMMEQGQGPFQWMMTSAFMAGRLLGISAEWSMVLQVPFTLAGAVFVWRAWRSDADAYVKFSMLAVAGLMATPQAFNYDMIPLAAVAVLLAGKDGSLRDRLTSQLLWALPILIMALNVIRLPLAPLILLGIAVHLDRTRIACALPESRNAIAPAK